MNVSAKILSNLGYILIIISIVFIFENVDLLVSHWHELFTYDSYKMIGGGIPQKDVLFYDIFRWLLLLIGGIGFMNKNVFAWIFIQAFVILTFCTAAINLLSDFATHYESINLNYFLTLIISGSIMFFLYITLNQNAVKEELGVDKYQKIWLWSSIFASTTIGILILELL
ncbi:hypothetical protein [Flavobacterium salmonis]|uniref:Uncharacterized protein n=1 Tax=Flavobacterium salmonis TaxID=2654844 RepID=A0A6V6ZCP8_9FLAO|nr:hypothetical protein [Flavobacterium salmonis]CAD0009530.1 hypothetical protein FLAT13_04982 [Flavobacterium salmonis]